ncbi:MAG: hypothetical protein H6572_02235 [Lewinellaceae bacterium]|nr:hypothetical protein [Lewinellaceae bacterium]
MSQDVVDAAFSNWLAGFDYTGGCTVLQTGLNVTAPNYWWWVDNRKLQRL